MPQGVHGRYRSAPLAYITRLMAPRGSARCVKPNTLATCKTLGMRAMRVQPRAVV